MVSIPVTFNYNGKEYKGHFTQVLGAGSTAMFHLTVDGFYFGRLRYSEFANGWVFDHTPNTEGLERSANECGDFDYCLV